MEPPVAPRALHVEFDQSVEDIVHFQKFHQRRAQVGRRRGLGHGSLGWVAMGLVVVVALALLSFTRSDPGTVWIWRWALPWLPMVALVVLLLAIGRRQRRALARALLSRADGTRRRIELTPEALLARTQASEERTLWSGIIAIEEDSLYVYLYRLDHGVYGVAHVVPKRALAGPEAAAAFIETARAFRDGRPALLPPLSIPDAPAPVESDSSIRHEK